MYIYIYPISPLYIYGEREKDIIKICVCEMPAAAHGLQGSEANILRQTDRPNRSLRHAERKTDLQSGS